MFVFHITNSDFLLMILLNASMHGSELISLTTILNLVILRAFDV